MTVNETCITDTYQKRRNKRLIFPGESATIKTDIVLSARNVMATVFCDWQDVIYID